MGFLTFCSPDRQPPMARDVCVMGAPSAATSRSMADRSRSK